MNPSAQSSLGGMKVTPQGGLKVRIESERPTHVMDAVLAEWVFVIYTRDEDGGFVYTGPYSIDHLVADDHIDLIPNRHYFDDNVLRRPQIAIKKFADGHDLAIGVQNNELDIAFHLPIDTLPELRNVEGVQVKSFEGMMMHVNDHKMRPNAEYVLTMHLNSNHSNKLHLCINIFYSWLSLHDVP